MIQTLHAVQYMVCTGIWFGSIVSPGYPAYCTISRDIAAYCTISRDIAAYCTISRDIAAYCTISRDIVAYCTPTTWPIVLLHNSCWLVFNTLHKLMIWQCIVEQKRKQMYLKTVFNSLQLFSECIHIGSHLLMLAFRKLQITIIFATN